ncbi:MAG: ABC transporter substrate-binding protein [Bacteroidaceae bacterium]|nr:ABC transporter substrate-binding protein [Bacteroidaceae bacterium]
MKRISRIFFVVAVLMGISLQVFAKDDDRNQILKVYNWADYIDEDLITEFEEWYKQQTGEDVEVIYQTFDINEVMLTKIEKGHEDYDVVCPSEYIIERMLRNNLLLPISKDFGSTPDYTKNVSPYAKDQFAKMSNSVNANDYAVGYMWGTTGVMYNTAMVTKEEASTWGILWDPKYESKILMKDAVRDVYGSIMMYVRQNEIKSGKVSRSTIMNDGSDDALKLFEDTMIAAKNNIAGWEVDFGKERMVQGKAWVNVTWSGDAMWAMDEVGDAVDLDYVVPEEGSNVWFDGWVIPKFAKNTKAASYFINYMCIPENAIRNMEEIGYVSVIATPEIMDYITDDELEETIDLTYFFGEDADSVKASPILYPDAKVIERCALMHDCGDRTEAMLDMWSRIKGDSLNIGMLLIVAATVIIIVVLVTINVMKKSKSKKKKSRGKGRR